MQHEELASFAFESDPQLFSNHKAVESISRDLLYSFSFVGGSKMDRESLDLLRLELDDESIDYASETTIIFGIFKDLTKPEIYLSAKGKICTPERFSIRMGGSRNVLRILMQPDIFLTLPLKMVKAILDLLILILQREPYDVVRFQFNNTVPTSSDNPVMIKILLRLLDVVSRDLALLSLSKRLIHLIGITASVGISMQDMKKFILLMKTPSAITISCLQALHMMIRMDVGINKASPGAFFCFGGMKSGLYVHLSTFPFTREYQFTTWFRIENFADEEAEHKSNHNNAEHISKAFNIAHPTTQHILVWQNPAHKGLDVYIDNKYLIVAVSSHSKTEPIIIKVGQHALRKGVWYHLSIRHSKPRVAIFSSDELSVSLDNEVLYYNTVRFPNLGNLVDTELFVGHNFDGQMTPIYFFSEAISSAALEAISSIDGGIDSDLLEANGISSASNVSSDLLPSITSSDRKIHPILSKVAFSYHPKRCNGEFALDIHNKHHAYMGRATQAWSMTNPRDLFITMGGVSCLLPLFPRLLVENEYINNTNSNNMAGYMSNSNINLNNVSSLTMDSSIGRLSPMMRKQSSYNFMYSSRIEYNGNGLGTSIIETWDEGYASMLFEYTVVQAIRSRYEEFQGDGCISLLINILSKVISNHRPFQIEVLNGGAVELIEYAISCVPPELMLNEGEKCVLALLQLKSTAASLPTLELRITKLLLCNITLWSGASYVFLTSLLSVILAAIKAQPDTFLRLLGIRPFLEGLDIFSNFDGEDDLRSFTNSMDTAYQTAGAADNEQSSAIAVLPPPPPLESPKRSALRILSAADMHTPTGESSSETSPMNNMRPTAIANLRVAIGDIGAIDQNMAEMVGSSNKDYTQSNSNSNNNSALQSPAIDTFSVQSTNKRGVKFFSEEGNVGAPSTGNAVPKTPRSSGMKPKLRKLKSFKLALSEAMIDDEAEDDNTRLGAVLEVIGEQENEQDEDRPVLQRMRSSGDSQDVKKQLRVETDISTQNQTSFDPLYDVKEVEDELSPSHFDSPITPQTNYQRKQLREHLLSIIVILILQGSTEKELMPFMEYIASCVDKVVLNEIAQVLLYLIVEGSAKIISAIITASNGPEEFASFVLVYMVHQPFEELRCTGIRILTHFYSKVDLASSAALHMSMKKKKSSLTKALNTLTQTHSAGMQRLQICGGLALLCEVVSSHSKASSELTYAALLELLMTKSTSYKAIMQYDVLDPTSPHAVNLNLGANNNSVSGSKARQGTVSGDHTFYPSKSLKFAAHYLSLDRGLEDNFDLFNPIILPIFFDLIPKLPMFLHEQIYTDFMSLLKHGSGFRQTFLACPSWHFCMFGLVSQLVNIEEYNFSARTFHTIDVISELEKWTGIGLDEVSQDERKKTKRKSTGALLRSWSNQQGGSFQSLKNLDRDEKRQSLPLSSSSATSSSPQKDATLSQCDLWFDIGMKIYSTLLQQALEQRNGWKELDRSMALSLSNEGYSVAQAILSHLLNEVTFKMKPKYKELQKLAKSNIAAETQIATDKLENFLSIMMTASQVALYDRQCVCGTISNFEICKLRVHLFNDLARKHISQKNKAEVGNDGSNNATSIPSRTQDELQNLTPNELRGLLEETEVELQTIIDNQLREEEVGKKGRRHDSLDLNNFEEYVEFYHIWQDITAEPVNMSSSGQLESTKVVSINPYKSTEELLHPLVRLHDTNVGKLILVLQTLRLFDIIFWPHADAQVRNTEMLRFSKDPLPVVVAANAKQTAPQEDRIQMTMYSAVMRMCMSCLHTLSPMTHLAVLNIKRLKAMICSIDRISPINTPTYDWLLATVASVTLNLQRLITVIEPAYLLVGMEGVHVKVKTVGPWPDSYDDYDRLSTEDQSVISDALEDKVRQKKLQQYFHSTPGRNVVRNIRSCLFLLLDAFENHHSKLLTSVEERTYRSLWVLVEQIKADIYVAREGGNLSSSPPPTASSPIGAMPIRALSRNLSSLKVDDVVVDNAGDIFETPVAAPALSPLPSMGNFKSRSYSESSVGDQAGSSEMNVENTSQDTLPTISYESFVEEAFSGQEIVLTLKWLRYPYFYQNILRNVRIIQALDALDYLEDRSVQKFVKSNVGYKEEVENHRDVAIKSIEEMTELKELSREVSEMLIERGESRLHSVKLSENIKGRNVAARWYDVLQMFEGDWSPWCSAEAGSTPGVSYYEISGHRDTKFRNMILTKLPEPISHIDHAYFDSKLKDQLQYEQGLGESSKEISIADAGNNRGSTIVPFKMLTLTLNTRNNNPTNTGNATNVWDEEEDNEEDEDTNKSNADTNPLFISDMTKIFFQANEKRPLWTLVFHWAADERILCILDVTQITVSTSVYGTICVTNRCIYFHHKKIIAKNHYTKQTSNALTSKPLVDRRYYIDRIVEAYGRRYLLQNCAIELYFIDSSELFLAFNSLHDLQKFFKILKNQNLPLLTTPKYLNPKFIFKNSLYTELWRRRLISNFDYLMKLNIISGRSYNDITQYPVFPWILSDYRSPTIDLQNPSFYRNLSLPVGALNPSRLKEFLDRYSTFDDENVPKFMYGSHYSSAGIVLYYLVRQEPFTSLAIALQNGRFDCPDRIFFDLEKTWLGCNSSMSDVKEMIPEMFYNPNILLNSEQLPLGELQDGGEVNNVRLPPWCHNDPYEFIRIHREALESEYVSEHLNQWIDLVFGVKQNGPQAVQAHNVFYYLTYENAINIEGIEDPLQREAAKAQVTHFGQTPSQLLKKEHPKRLPREECPLPLFSTLSALLKLQVYTPSGLKQAGRGLGAVLSIRCIGERVVMFHSIFHVCSYRWSLSPDPSDPPSPFTIRPERSKALPSAALAMWAGGLEAEGKGEGGREGRRSKEGEEGTPPPLLSQLPKSASYSAGGLLSSWRSNFKMGGKASPRSAPLSSAPTKGTGGEASTTLYNAMRLEKRSPAHRERSLHPPSSASNPPTPVSLSFASASSSSLSPRINHQLLSLYLPTDNLSAGRVISCGYWDESLKVHSIDTMREVCSTGGQGMGGGGGGGGLGGHLGNITCVQVGNYHGALVFTGGQDGTMRVWVLEKAPLGAALSKEVFYGEPVEEGGLSGGAGAGGGGVGTGGDSPLQCVHVLWGHSSPITALSFSPELDLLFSGGEDGLLCLHTARQGAYLRSLSTLLGSAVDVVLACPPGYLLAHSGGDLSVHLFWVNGTPLRSVQVKERVECMLSAVGGMVLWGMAGGVSVRETHSLEERGFIPLDGRGGVRCMTFSDDQQFLFVGCGDGTYSIIADAEARLKLLSLAVQKTPLLGGSGL